MAEKRAKETGDSPAKRLEITAAMCFNFCAGPPASALLFRLYLIVTTLHSIQKFVSPTLPQETIEICEDMFS
jgi:hypothetical protein